MAIAASSLPVGRDAPSAWLSGLIEQRIDGNDYVWTNRSGRPAETGDRGKMSTNALHEDTFFHIAVEPHDTMVVMASRRAAQHGTTSTSDSEHHAKFFVQIAQFRRLP